MKKIATTLCLISATGLTKAAVLIAGWNFNIATANPAPTPIAADHGSGSLDLSQFSSGDARIDGTSSGLNEAGSDLAGNALSLRAGTSEVENGQSIEFTLSMFGYQDLVLTYATVGTSTGFTGQDWSYSTDGGNTYISSGVAGSSVSVPTSYTLETVDFSSASINNASSVLFRLTVSGAAGSSAGSDHFDNIQFNGDLIAVPEPTWGAISALGLLGICAVREWRQRKQAQAA